MENTEKKMTFETALARLEDESLALFEEGVGLVKFCTGELDNAEQRVKILQAGEEGSLVEKDFAKPE